MATMAKPADPVTVEDTADEDDFPMIGGNPALRGRAPRVLTPEQSERFLRELEAEPKPLTPKMQQAIALYRTLMKK
jgi:hypothetical protein